MTDRRCALCGAKLRRGNQGPFCSSKECTKAHFALQAFVHGELGGRGMGHVTINSITRDADGIYTICGSYLTRKDENVRLNEVRFNCDGIAMGQRVTIRWSNDE